MGGTPGQESRLVARLSNSGCLPVGRANRPGGVGKGAGMRLSLRLPSPKQPFGNHLLPGNGRGGFLLGPA